MNIYIATVVKTGNSLALRVPKKYADDASLKPGDKVNLPLPQPEKRQNRAKINRLIRDLQDARAYSSISDPAAWQREIRRDRPDPRG